MSRCDQPDYGRKVPRRTPKKRENQTEAVLQDQREPPPSAALSPPIAAGGAGSIAKVSGG
jgi:hypothetical protein